MLLINRILATNGKIGGIEIDIENSIIGTLAIRMLFLFAAQDRVQQVHHSFLLLLYAQADTKH